MNEMTRTEAIDALRSRLVKLADDDHCICDVASKLHVFCGGFSRLKSHELRERYDWIVKRRPHITRKELEELANRWQLARQFLLEKNLACDAETLDRNLCRGWDEFSDEELATQVRELLCTEVEIVPAAPAGKA